MKTIYDPRSPFTVAQEARIREIVREEIDFEALWRSGAEGEDRARRIEIIAKDRETKNRDFDATR